MCRSDYVELLLIYTITLQTYPPKIYNFILFCYIILFTKTPQMLQCNLNYVGVDRAKWYTHICLDSGIVRTVYALDLSNLR